MSIEPWIMGRGRAGQAIAKSLACISVLHPELGVAPAQWLPRDASLEDLGRRADVLLCIANPPGLHAQALLQAEKAGIGAILCEKPACVTREEVRALRGVRAQVAVLHVYRMMWGPQTLKTLLAEDTFGDLIAIEGRYWQASTAARALRPEAGSVAWKNDVALSGPADTLLDVGTHWIDMACFLAGGVPDKTSIWKSYQNAETPHRDSHVQLALDFAGRARAFASISKTMHGATNDFEITVLGTRGSATWRFLQPDEIVVGAGRERRILARCDASTGSMQPPFHGTGWLEGYMEIGTQLLRQTVLKKPGTFPRLSEALDILAHILPTEADERRAL